MGEQLCQKVEPVSDTFVDEHVLSRRHQADVKFSQNGIHSWFLYLRQQFFQWLIFCRIEEMGVAICYNIIGTWRDYFVQNVAAVWMPLVQTRNYMIQESVLLGSKSSKLAIGSTTHRIVAGTYLKRTHTQSGTNTKWLSSYNHVYRLLFTGPESQICRCCTFQSTFSSWLTFRVGFPLLGVSKRMVHWILNRLMVSWQEKELR